MPLVTPSPMTLNATIGNSSCHNICDKDESSEYTSIHDCPWNWLKKGKKGNDTPNLDIVVIDSKFDDQEQPNDLVDDTLEEMEVSVTKPRKFDVLRNVIHSSSNVDLTKNFENRGNDATNSQARTQMEKPS
ncbi:hypothetical protein ACH5RR_029730 [Cinchona calisaya]|uniref:Uncharacterized protein n=1 Tax=Cinchona calisaya TaxID=153742 RepID=A0ABD2YSI3_9GENT